MKNVKPITARQSWLNYNVKVNNQLPPKYPIPFRQSLLQRCTARCLDWCSSHFRFLCPAYAFTMFFFYFFMQIPASATMGCSPCPRKLPMLARLIADSFLESAMRCKQYKLLWPGRPQTNKSKKIILCFYMPLRMLPDLETERRAARILSEGILWIKLTPLKKPLIPRLPPRPALPLQHDQGYIFFPFELHWSDTNDDSLWN